MKAIITELHRVLFQTDLREKFEEKVRARLATFKVRSGEERKGLTLELARVDGEVGRLVSYVRTLDPATNPTVFETLHHDLERAVAEQKTIKAKLAALSEPEAESRLPTEQEIVDAVLDIERRIQFDPTTAREQFHRMLLDGKMTLTPQPDGSWQVVSALPVGRLVGTRKPRSGGPTGASGIATDKVEIGSCAGRI